MRRFVMLCMVALFNPLVAKAGTFTTLANFPAHIDGAVPAAALVELNGQFYGTTSGGGSGQAGTIFRLGPSTGKETLLYSFVGNYGSGPSAPLTVAAGKLYGITGTGGAGNGGKVFSFDPATNTETLLYSFPDAYAKPTGAFAELGGLLYGTATFGGANGYGSLYTIDPVTGTETTVYSFKGGKDGEAPQGGVTIYNGELYGVTASGGSMLFGTLFRLNPTTGAVTTLYAFGRENSVSDSSTAGLTVLGDVLYGTAQFGGSNFYGTVYAFDLSSGKFSVVHSFSLNNTDGYLPASGLLALNGLLYGTTSRGGASNNGTVFSVDPVSGAETILHSFNGQDGYDPEASLIWAGGLLIGTTDSGGVEGEGIAFSLDPSSGKEVSLYNFLGSPYSANSALIDFRGALYGTSTQAGLFNAGSIFKVNPHTHVVTTLHSFSGLDGVLPSTALINISGVLYGATSSGGTYNAGTLFSFDPTSRKQTTLFSFDNATSATSPKGLTSEAGILYGSTSYGSNSGTPYGTLFSFDPATGTLTTLYEFSAGQNAQPGIIAVNGTLFGTVLGGSPSISGTVFSFALSSGKFSTVHSFEGAGEYPVAGLVYANGMLVGSTEGYKKDPATIFQIDPATGTETVLHTFSRPEPIYTMISVGNRLYGAVGITFDRDGSIFRLDPATQRFKTLYNFTGSTDGGGTDAALLAINNHLFGTTGSSGAGDAGTIFRFDQ